LNGDAPADTVEQGRSPNPIFVPPSPVSPSNAIPRTCYAALVALLTLGLAPVSTAQSPHLRVLDQPLKTLLDRGAAQSPTLRRLVEEVETTPVLIFVECAMKLPSGVGGRTNFVTSVNAMRFVRVAIDCTLTERWQTTLMAHEIQHALEIGRRPDVDDVEAMEELYEEIGIPTVRDRAHRHFETAEAMAVQRAVEQELEGRGARAPNAY
jgi:hypothetical protein